MKHTILLLLIFILPNIVRAQSPADSCVITCQYAFLLMNPVKNVIMIILISKKTLQFSI